MAIDQVQNPRGRISDDRDDLIHSSPVIARGRDSMRELPMPISNPRDDDAFVETKAARTMAWLLLGVVGVRSGGPSRGVADGAGARQVPTDDERGPAPLASARRCGEPGTLGGSHLVSPRALGARLDLELNSLAADEPIKVERGVEAAAMEEVFLRVLGGDETEAAVGDDLLDGTGGHEDLQHFPNRRSRAHGPFEKGSTTRSRCWTQRSGA